MSDFPSDCGANTRNLGTTIGGLCYVLKFRILILVPDDLNIVVLRVDDDGAAAAEGHGGDRPLEGGGAPAAAEGQWGTAATAAIGGLVPARRPPERASVAGVENLVIRIELDLQRVT